MANDGQIVFEVTADGRHAIADIREITRVIQRETRQWDNAADQSANNIDSSFSGVLKKLAAGFSAAKIGKQLLDIGKKAIEAASDLAEVQNVVDVTFGANNNKIETWAKSAGTQFGLTETQAKKFASTMGAMLKSSGMAGSEIEDVSTDLAGLAADMASFYNLDFDTAFQKIRSGISGETEPLKQLGINMSTANLNAYALEKGLSKTFEQMNQGEQAMLRYQYLMRATADAQGDFARTSDGYANQVRLLETNLQTLSTNLGTVLIDVINPLLQGVNALFPAEGGNRHSIIDDITQIQINKDEKLREIEAIKSVADELILTLETIGTDKNASTQLSSLAEAANTLDSSSVGNWQAVLSSLKGIDGLEHLFGENNGVGTVEDLAAALAGESVTTNKAQAWQIFLSALADNADAVSALTGQSAGDTKAWLEGMAQAAGELSPEDAAAWNTLMTSLLSGVGMGQTDEGKKFVELLAQNFLALGKDSEEAVNGLKALGFSTEEIEDKQAAWLRTCKELVKQIPGLSSIIDTNTGEVKGGIPAIKEYADQWERTAKYQAEVEAIRASRQAYEEKNNPATLQAESVTARAIARARLKGSYSTDEIDRELDNVRSIIQRMVDAGANNWEQILKGGFNAKTIFGGDVDTVSGATVTQMIGSVYGVDPAEFNWINKLYGEGEEAVLAYAEAVFTEILAAKELPEVLNGIEQEEQRVQEEYGVTAEELEAQTKAAEEAAASMTTLEKAAAGDADAMATVTSATQAANAALQEMADYAANAHKAALDAINSVAKGLDKVDFSRFDPAKIDKITKLTAEQSNYDVGSDKWKELQAEIDKTNDGLVTTNSIYSNLESQADFLDSYLENIRKARGMGLSDALLAELSDGSVESAQYLDALVNDKTGKTAAEIDAKYQEIQEKKAALATELSNQQLTVDQTYQALAEKAKEAIAALDLGEEAAANAGDTIAGIASGINAHEGEVAEAVNGIIAQLERLNGFGITLDFGGFGNITFTTSAGKTEGSGRMGLDFVPHDDYIARLHEGERVLTAQENQVWNALRNGGIAGFDLETLGGVMRDNVKPGGNVYLDGRVVGSVISEQQGKSYRQLQRSGWQA